jgi:hypothetical protein
MFGGNTTEPNVPAAPAAPAPTPYAPKFRGDVVVQGYGYSQPVNPMYCLDESSVSGLIAELKAAGLTAVAFERDPLGRFAGGFSESATVPWLHFSDGTEINAALLAYAYAHGYPPSYARNLAVRGYQQAAYSQGFGPEPPTSPVTA